ncbi:MAG: response regulator [Planctomycetota bacterium]|jgi:DNA-binding response OmpR family regulator
MEIGRIENPRVLVIEDDPGHQRLLELYLKRAGCQCDCCFDGKSGLQQAIDADYDIVFADINTPEMDGFMVATLLREQDSKVVLVAITALELEGIKRKAMAVGYDDFLQKPLQRETIEAVLKKHLTPEKSKS